MPKSKKEFISLLAKRMNTDESTAKQWVDAYTETLYEIFQSGNGVTIDGLGGFHLNRKHSGNVFKFNPSQKIRALLGWSSTFKQE
jgi:nucleoid DNA-binding protein